jgi:hypothetical protein
VLRPKRRAAANWFVHDAHRVPTTAVSKHNLAKRRFYPLSHTNPKRKGRRVETIIPTIFKQRISGAMKKCRKRLDQNRLTADHSSFLQSNFMHSYLAATPCARSVPLCEARRDLYGSQNCLAYRSWFEIANIAPYRLLSRTWNPCVGDAMSNQIQGGSRMCLETQCGMDRNTHSSGDASRCAEPFEATLE